jgi:hypothetical protein
VREGLGPTGRLWVTDSSPDATLTGDAHAGGSRSAPKQGRWGGASRWGPGTVSGGAGQKWFKPFPKFKQFKNV